jgi:hypothetical protein
MGVCAFCGDSARAERMTSECVPSYGGAHEAQDIPSSIGPIGTPREPTLPGKPSSRLRHYSNTT